MALQHLRSSTANKRPLPAGMSDGQLAINTNNTSPGLFFKDSAGALVKVGPVHVGTTAPNASPASGGETGNTVGEQWLDTTGGTYVFKVWDGSAWRSESGTFVDVNGDTMTGALGIIAGTAAAPGLYFSGDTDTGIYSPAANELAISTNGTGRLFINDNRLRLGVGSQFQITDTTDTNGLQLTGSTAGDCVVGTLANQSLVLRSNGTERLRISGGGRVQLPTTSQFQITDNADVTGLQFIGSSSAASTIGTMGAHDLLFRTNSSERLRITSAGLVGIGTSAPSTLFHCAGTARFGANDATDIELQIGAGATGNRAAYIDFVGDTTYSDYGLRIIRNGTGANTNSLFAHRGTGDLQLNALEAGAIGLFTNDTQRLRITSAGNVGIGTTAVDVKTQIVKNALTKSWSADGDDVLAIENSGTTNVDFRSGSSSSTYLMFSDGDARARGYVAYLHSSDALLLGAANSERARIDSSGRLLVGTSSYSFAATAVLQGNSSASNEDAALRINRGGTPGANADLGLITFGDNAGNIGAAIRATNDTASSWGSGDYPGRLTFSTTADGASSPTERMRITSRGETALHVDANSSAWFTSTTAGAGTTYATYKGAHSATGTFTGTVSFQVFSNGNVENTNNSYTGISDIKLKENIVDASSQWDDIKALRPVNYNFKPETGQQTHTQLGLIAQEVELVSPGLVYETPDRDADGNDLGTTTKAVQYSVLYMKAVKALQEAMERIETLEAKVAALESA